jgi:PAS domain S-box-containing protein
LLRLRPYKTLENKIDGAVVMLVDVDAIKRAHAYTESVVATVREPLLVLDKDLRVRTASRAFYERFRTTPEDTENRLLFEMGGQWANPELRRLLEEVLSRDNQVKDFAVEHQFEGIGTRTMRLNARRLIQAADQAPLILLAVEDVTESEAAAKALRDSEQRLRFIMDSMPQKIFTATPNGDLDYFNPVWAQFTGLSFEQIKGWGWKHFIHPGDVEESVRRWQHSINTGKPFQFEHRFRRADGEYRWHLSRAQAMRDVEGKVVMWVGSNTDIHEQRETASQLRQYAADLAESDRRKTEFLAMLAHELRNPLAPIRNALQIMELKNGDEKAVQSASRMMERQIGLVVRLVDDLLDVSRISRGKIELRRRQIELASVIRHAVETSRPAMESAKHVLTVTLPPQPVYLNGDPARLAQVVGNLLNNACKFTNTGGHIWLTVERKVEQAAIRVRDTGIGIAADQLPRIFDMFTQVDTSLERSAGGLGIGLTLVKNLVEMHGGTVEVYSAGVGQGSEFVVHLPILAETHEPPPPEPTAREPPPTTARRILVVDDNWDSAESLAMLLKLTGNETYTAQDGLEAVEAAATFRPEVVLLDIGLPKLNGYDAARKIRERPWGKSMVLVALTGWGQQEDRQKSKAAGFDGHLVKPVDHAALMRLLAELLPTPT